MRYFNTEGQCEPDLHYMVRLDERADRIKRFFVDAGKYFAINRGRQYGKTTALHALEDLLREDYTVVPMDFQGISTAEFSDEDILSLGDRVSSELQFQQEQENRCEGDTESGQNHSGSGSLEAAEEGQGEVWAAASGAEQ